jgi:photosystem II stability/assembly factor-like uncharacterized protein
MTVAGNSVLLRSEDSGKSWTRLPSQGYGIVYGLWGDGRTLVIAGGGGSLYRSEDGGLSWKEQEGHTANELYEVWGSGPDDLYVVGAAGTILHYGPAD